MCNKKNCLISSLVVFIVLFVTDFLIHGILLKGIYEETASIWRPESESLMWLMWVGYVVFAPVFVAIYKKGYDATKKGLGQGLRFGVLIGLLMSVLPTLVWYAVVPIPVSLAVYWFLGGMVQLIACGIALGLVYKP